MCHQNVGAWNPGRREQSMEVVRDVLGRARHRHRATTVGDSRWIGIEGTFPYRGNLTLVGAGCVKCLFRATGRQVIPRGWMSNTYDYLPDCFDHQLWLILVDVMATVFGYEEA